MDNKILLYSKSYYDFTNFESHKYDISDIAHSLSGIARFTGHSERVYTVAQHSVVGSYLVPPEYALEFLLHDGSEHVLGDVSSPLKAILKDYKRLEKRVEKSICTQFNLPFPMSKIVKQADKIMIAREFYDLFDGHIHNPEIDLTGYKPIKPWSRNKSKKKFLQRYHELVGTNAEHFINENGLD